ncbi:hypothetical protein [Nonomuraea sp. NPDC049695]|uniref:DUF7158 domain-containing protein n=1 Tax=Nonomuraea sp. NPDC049695 TaxID=3154734 RepID=UPI0034328838
MTTRMQQPAGGRAGGGPVAEDVRPAATAEGVRPATPAEGVRLAAPAEGVRPAATGAASAPGIGAVAGWVDGRPIPRERLERRLADLRNGPFRATLPVPGSSEDRQLARWLTQVILTEALCEAVAADLGLDPVEAEPFEGVAAVELGSINTAAYNGNPWVRAVFEHVTATMEAPPEWRSPARAERPPQYLIRHRLFPDHSSAHRATPDALDSLGPAASLDSLPAAIAEALQRHPHGTLVGPVQDALGWHVAIVTPFTERGAALRPPPTACDAPTSAEQATIPPRQDRSGATLLDAARRRTFARRLDDLRAKKVELVPGLEHPGDPRQPDNHHKH